MILTDDDADDDDDAVYVFCTVMVTVTMTMMVMVVVVFENEKCGVEEEKILTFYEKIWTRVNTRSKRCEK